MRCLSWEHTIRPSKHLALFPVLRLEHQGQSIVFFTIGLNWKKKIFVNRCLLVQSINGMIKMLYEICSKLAIKTQEQRQWPRSSVFIVNFEHISNISLVFPLSTLKKKMMIKITITSEHLGRYKFVNWQFFIFSSVYPHT